MVDFDLNELFAGLVLSEGESDGDVREIFRQFAYERAMVSCKFSVLQSLHATRSGFVTSGTLDGYNSRANVNLHIIWDDQLLLGEDVFHLEQWCGCALRNCQIIPVAKEVRRRLKCRSALWAWRSGALHFQLVSLSTTF